MKEQVDATCLAPSVCLFFFFFSFLFSYINVYLLNRCHNDKEQPLLQLPYITPTSTHQMASKWPHPSHLNDHSSSRRGGSRLDMSQALWYVFFLFYFFYYTNETKQVPQQWRMATTMITIHHSHLDASNSPKTAQSDTSQDVKITIAAAGGGGSRLDMSRALW